MAKAKTFFDVGTYTGNGGLYRVGVPTLRTAYNQQVARSLRFRASNSGNLSRTFSSPTNGQKWTLSAWVKKSLNGGQYPLLTAGSFATAGAVYFDGTYQGEFLLVVLANTTYRTSAIKFRDPSIWSHIVVAVDTTQAIEVNRCIIYWNGNQLTWTSSYSITQNATFSINSNVAHYIGNNSGSSPYFDGYMSEVNFIDGQALTPSSFGELNSDGIWMPKSYSGTYGTNGFYLNFSDNSGATSTTIGKDSSGNSNNWTPSGISVTAGTTNDSLTDTPTDYGTDTGAGGEVRGNYWTLNPLDKSTNTTLANGNLEQTPADATANYRNSRATLPLPAQKLYWEVTAIYSGSAIVSAGIGPSGATKNISDSGSTDYIGGGGWGSNAVGVIATDAVRSNGTLLYSDSSGVTGDTYGFAWDGTTGKVYIHRNSTYFNSGNPVSGTGSVITLTGSQFIVASTRNSGAKLIFNFGQRPFAYTAPSGFKALTTANITAPADASKWFYGGVPDLVWIKDRTSAYDHSLTDTVRGVGLNLISDTTGADASGPDISEMNKFGMSLIGPASSNRVNASGDNYVYWAWKAGGAAVTNTNGSISSQVSANPTNGFSVVTYTGTGANATVGHGLGVAPSMIIVKNRDVTRSWAVYHISIGNTKNIYLNSSGATNTSSTYWNNTSPTSSVFSVGSDEGANESTKNQVAYCFAAIPGFSAFGSFTGNGSTDGPFVFCGFRPRWILIKSSSNNTDWWVWDSSRNTYNVMNAILYPDLSNAEYSDASTFLFDIVSNGFKYRTSNATVNSSGGTYIYAAFAETPFKYALGR